MIPSRARHVPWEFVVGERVVRVAPVLGVGGIVPDGGRLARQSELRLLQREWVYARYGRGVVGVVAGGCDWPGLQGPDGPMFPGDHEPCGPIMPGPIMPGPIMPGVP